MLDFLKKVLKKDDDALLDAHAKEYYEKLLTKTYDIWIEKEVLERLGVNLIKKMKYVPFSQKDKMIAFDINPNLTREELVDCLIDVTKMLHKYKPTSDTIDVFIKKYIDEHPEIQASFDEYIENKWNCGHRFRYNSDVYLLDIFEDLYKKQIGLTNEAEIRIRNDLSTKTDDELRTDASMLLNALMRYHDMTAKTMAVIVNNHLVLTNNNSKLKAIAERQAAERLQKKSQKLTKHKKG